MPTTRADRSAKSAEGNLSRKPQIVAVDGLAGHQSEAYCKGHLLGKLSSAEQLAHFDQLLVAREAELLGRHGPFAGAHGNAPQHVLSVGCGPTPHAGVPEGKHYLIGLDSDPARVEQARQSGKAQEVRLGTAQQLPFDDSAFDVVVYRLVLHHLVYQGPMLPVFEEARRVLRPGGAIIVVEPNIYNPIGLLLALANQLRVSRIVRGTNDDCPLSPLRMRRQLASLGFEVQIFGLEYSWRRLPVVLQKFTTLFSFLGETPVLRYAAHTFMLIGCKKSLPSHNPLPTEIPR